MKHEEVEVVPSSGGQPVVMQSGGVLQVLRRCFLTVWEYPLRPIRDLPVLKKPVADPCYLPQNTHNPIFSVVQMTRWAWKSVEFSIEPTRKGWVAWVRIILNLCMPLLVLGVVFCCLTWVVRQMLDVSTEVTKLAAMSALGGGTVLVLLLVLYFVHFTYLRLRLRCRKDTEEFKNQNQPDVKMEENS